MEASDDGNYIFVGMREAIRIYNKVEEQVIYKYDRQNGDRQNLYFTTPQFNSDQTIAFTTGKFAIGVDLKDGKEIFREESEGFYTASVFRKPILFQNKRITYDK